jgi:recombinational DNA repair ATPase RecF
MIAPWFDDLNIGLKTTCHALSGEQAEVQFTSSQPAHLPLINAYLAQLKKNQIRERQFGLTMTGPHRDDLSILIDAKPARLYASDGQKRTAIATLRLAE